MAFSANSELIIRIGGDAKRFDQALGLVSKQTEALERKLSSLAKISGVAFAALTGTAALAINEFAKFDNSLRGVKTLLDEASFGSKGLEQGFSDMRKEILAVGKSIPVNIGSLNKALFDTVSAGVSADKAVGAVAVSAKLAVAGLTDVSIATDGLTSALNAYQLSADQAEVVASKFFTAQKFGKTTIAELAGGFGLVGANAQAAGLSLNELLASVAAVTTAGVKTNAAYTGLKAVLANISKPTDDAAKEAKRLGIEFNATSLRAKGLDQFLAEIAGSANFTKDSIVKLFGSTEAQTIAFALLGAQSEKFREILGGLGNETESLATLQQAYAVQSASVSNQVARFQNLIQVLAIKIGGTLAPAFESILSKVNAFLNYVSESPMLINFTVAVGGMAAALAGLGLAFGTAGLAALTLRNRLFALQAVNLVPYITGVSSGFRGLFTNVLTLAPRAVLSVANFGSVIITAFTRIPAVLGAASLASRGFFTAVMTGLRSLPVLIATLPGTFAGAASSVLAFGKSILSFNNILTVLRFGIRLLVGATGIGLIVIGLSTLLFSWDKTWAAIKQITSATIDAVGPLLKGLGNLLLGIVTFDTDKITAGWEQVKNATVAGANKTIDAVKDLVGSRQDDLSVAPSVGGTGRPDSGKKGSSPDDSNKELAAMRAQEARKEEARRAHLEILRLENEKASAQMIALARQEAEIKKQIAETTDEEELELLRQKHENVMELEAEQREIDKEQRRVLEEELLAENEEFQALSDEQKELFRLKNEEALRSQILNKKNIEQEATKARLKEQVETNNQFLLNQKKYGTLVATLDKTVGSKRVKDANVLSGELVSLSQSENSTLKAIGKAGAISQIGISTAQSAVVIAQKVIDVLPFPINVPVAAALSAARIAFGAEQIAKVNAANKGGIVPGFGPDRDSTLSFLTPGELVVPRSSFDETVNAVAAGRAGQLPGQSGATESGLLAQAIDVLRSIEEKVSQPMQQYVIQGDVIGDDNWVDAIGRRLTERVRDGNLNLLAAGLATG